MKQVKTLVTYWKSRDGVVCLHPDTTSVRLLARKHRTFPLREFYTEEGQDTELNSKKALARLLAFINRQSPFSRGDFLVLHHKHAIEILVAVPDGFYPGKGARVDIPGRVDLFFVVPAPPKSSCGSQ